jgi:hypothetical protein
MSMLQPATVHPRLQSCGSLTGKHGVDGQYTGSFAAQLSQELRLEEQLHFPCHRINNALQTQEYSLTPSSQLEHTDASIS